MIAKLITYSDTREQTIDRQIAALDRFQVEGLGHNIDFLSALMQHPRFRAGALTTGFIAEEYPEGFSGAPTSPDLRAKLAVIAAVVAERQGKRATRISGQLNGSPAVDHHWAVRSRGSEQHVTLGEGRATVDSTEMELEVPYAPGLRLAEAVIDSELLSVRIEKLRAGRWRLTTRGASHDLQVVRHSVAALAHHLIEKTPPDTSRFLLSPMPGRLTQLLVGPGDQVELGQPLAVVEAMKMENVLRAGKGGVVKTINVAQGDSVAADPVILEIAPSE